MLPIRIISKVVKGFGRGSSELGIPTANLSSSPEDMKCLMSFDALPTGIYFGFARLASSPDTCSINSTSTDATTTNTNTTTNGANLPSLDGVYKAAISIGYNPCYNNEHKTIEPHLIAPPGHPSRSISACQETQFHELYNETMRLSIVGYLRPELPFEGLDKLIVAIKKDIVNTEESLSLSLSLRDVDGNNAQHRFLVESEEAWVLSNHGV
jgi:riboflavin kinase